MKYKTRYVYTVIRDAGKQTLDDAREDIEMMQDEVGEYLYGGAGDETITLKSELWDGKRWVKVQT